MENTLTINKNLFLELLTIPKEKISVDWIVPDEYIQVGFEVEYSKELQEEMKRLFDFYDCEIDEEEPLQFTGVYYADELEDDTIVWKLGYTIFSGFDNLEIDELLGTELDDLCISLAKTLLEDEE